MTCPLVYYQTKSLWGCGTGVILRSLRNSQFDINQHHYDRALQTAIHCLRAIRAFLHAWTR